MIRTESACVGCGLSCVPYCSYNHDELICECDVCRTSTEDLYDVGGQEMCFDCAFNYYKDIMIEECKDEIIEQYGEDYTDDDLQEYAEEWLYELKIEIE